MATLSSLGLFWLKTPAEFGGTPLTPLEFCDVIEELAYIDASTAWATMIGNGCGGMAGGWLPDEGARRVFGASASETGPGSLPLIAGQPQPRGVARPVLGGYVVSGRWGFSSGIVHAGWVIGGFPAPADPAVVMVFVAPKDDADVVDTWHVAGLQGTGSLDFRLSDVFVPASMTYVRGGPAFRGGALFRQPGVHGRDLRGGRRRPVPVRWRPVADEPGAAAAAGRARRPAARVGVRGALRNGRAGAFAVEEVR